ncbi:MAG: hypothetical protein ACR2QH_07925 [Geminicoccaceae bacterium]
MIALPLLGPAARCKCGDCSVLIIASCLSVPSFYVNQFFGHAEISVNLTLWPSVLSGYLLATGIGHSILGAPMHYTKLGLAPLSASLLVAQGIISKRHSAQFRSEPENGKKSPRRLVRHIHGIRANRPRNVDLFDVRCFQATVQTYHLVGGKNFNSASLQW